MSPDERPRPEAPPPVERAPRAPHLAPHLAVLRFGVMTACGALLGSLGAAASAQLVRPEVSLVEVLPPVAPVAAVCAAVVLGLATLLARVERLSRRLALTALLVPAVSLSFLGSIAWFGGLLEGGPSRAWVELLDSLERLMRDPEPLFAFAPFGLLALLHSFEVGGTWVRRALIEVGASGALGLVAVGVLSAAYGRPPSVSLPATCVAFALAPAAGMLGIHLGALVSARVERRLDPGD